MFSHSLDPLPPSAVGTIVSALAGNSASRSIRDSRVDDDYDYDVTAIGRLRCIVIRNALSATASELIRSIARSIPCGRRRAFQSCALVPLVHAQGGEMQTFFPCSNPACDEGLETLKHEFGTACQQCAWCRGTGGDRRESAEDDDACL